MKLSEQQARDFLLNDNPKLTSVRAVYLHFLRIARSILLTVLNTDSSADEVIDAALVKAWLKRRMFDPKRPAITWLSTLASRHTLDHIDYHFGHPNVSVDQLDFLGVRSRSYPDRGLALVELIDVSVKILEEFLESSSIILDVSGSSAQSLRAEVQSEFLGSSQNFTTQAIGEAGEESFVTRHAYRILKELATPRGRGRPSVFLEDCRRELERGLRKHGYRIKRDDKPNEQGQGGNDETSR